MTNIRKSSCRLNDGFSLLEVLVASAVLAIVMSILLGAVSTTLSLWRNTEGKLAADREGRAVELMMARDLASAIVPADPNLWPRVNNGRLQFLTAKSLDYQSGGNGSVDVGDVCFVEYLLSQDGSALLRNFLGSAETFERILSPATPGFPDLPASGAQLLATNLLVNARDAVRGLTVQNYVQSTNRFIVLNEDLLPRSPSDTNPPVAVEVNFGVTDPEGLANKDLLENPGFKLRNAGYYSFRIQLPNPVRVP